MNPPAGLPTPWVIFGLCCLFVAVAPIAVARHWTGRTQRFEYAISGTAFGSPALRMGHVRAIPVLFGGAFLIALGLLVLFFAPARQPAQDRWLVGYLYFAIGTVILAVLLYWSIVLFNRPRLLVAPNQRAEWGTVRSWRQRHRPHPGDGGSAAPGGSASHGGSGPARAIAGRRRRRAGRASGVLSFDLAANGGLIEIGDRDARRVPEWTPSATTAASNGTVVLVAVRQPSQGPVSLLVTPEHGRADGSPEAFSGRLSLPSGVVAVGNSLSGHLEELDLTPLRAVHIRVLVDSLDSPGAVSVLYRPVRD